jgi:hypothetical protein
MHKSLLTFALLALTSASTATADALPESIDPSHTIVSSQYETRILVYKVCSPEHCWSESYLQLLSSEPDQPSILCTTKIKELSVGYIITNVTWSTVNGGPSIEFSVAASHGFFEPHSVMLTPLDGCNYSVSELSVGT